MYSRTPEGTAEVTARAHPLSIPVRRLLNNLTSEMTLEQVQALARTPDLERMLKELVDRGLVLAPRSAIPAPTAAPAVSPATPPTIAPARSGDAASLGHLEFGAVKRLAVRFVNDHLGPGGEAVALRIERAKDAIILEQMVYDAHRILFELRGRAVADRFRVEVIEPGFGPSNFAP
jgi:hypothetical protein